ncbi:MAG: helix-hairpin-helix domain-containing protein [Alphaproteobacteria bacterium]|nr:helix-hairpin-helix domain-containing protein [Alphaproteobacteria bacterium]
MSLRDFDFDDVELEGLFDASVSSNRPPERARDLVDLGREMVDPYLDVIAGYVRDRLRHLGDVADDAIDAAVETLLTLTMGTGDERLFAHLQHLSSLSRAAPVGRASVDRWRVALRQWTEDMAAELGPIRGARFRQLVDTETGTTALLDELGGIRGMGPRRLQRLYCAGLYTVDAVLSVEADEMAAVSGVPRVLCDTVRTTTAMFKEQAVTRGVSRLERDAADLERALTRGDRIDSGDLSRLLAAHDRLSRMVHDLARGGV